VTTVGIQVPQKQQVSLFWCWDGQKAEDLCEQGIHIVTGTELVITGSARCLHLYF